MPIYNRLDGLGLASFQVRVFGPDVICNQMWRFFRFQHVIQAGSKHLPVCHNEECHLTAFLAIPLLHMCRIYLGGKPLNQGRGRAGILQ